MSSPAGCRWNLHAVAAQESGGHWCSHDLSPEIFGTPAAVQNSTGRLPVHGHELPLRGGHHFPGVSEGPAGVPM